MYVSQVLKFEVPGEPIAKGRPRFSNRGGYAIAYTPARTANYENLMKTTFNAHYPKHIPADNATEVIFKAYFSIPKSFSKKKREAAINGCLRPLKKPDTDNIAKMKDALNGIAWTDDKQVFKESIEKYYSERPRLEVEIRFYED